jgi:cyclopropane-fatty-acyl-phospholipid synthase
MALSTFAEKQLFGENPKFGERFYRLWKYYLIYCAGSFRARHVQLWQIVFSKHGVP